MESGYVKLAVVLLYLVLWLASTRWAALDAQSAGDRDAAPRFLCLL